MIGLNRGYLKEGHVKPIIIYLYYLFEKPKNQKEVCEALKIPRKTLYRYLKKLEELGLRENKEMIFEEITDNYMRIPTNLFDLGLNFKELQIFLAYLYFYNWKTKKCFPSIKSISKIARVKKEDLCGNQFKKILSKIKKGGKKLNKKKGKKMGQKGNAPSKKMGQKETQMGQKNSKMGQIENEMGQKGNLTNNITNKREQIKEQINDFSPLKKIQEEIFKEEEKKILKGDTKTLLNRYNTLLKEKFGITEDRTSLNLKLLKELFAFLQKNEIDFKSFIEDIILNWSYYQDKYFPASGIPVPTIKYVLKERVSLSFIFRKKVDLRKGLTIIKGGKFNE